jgi:hypothetical protein
MAGMILCTNRTLGYYTEEFFMTLDMGEDTDIRGRMARCPLLCIPLQDARLSGSMVSVIPAIFDAR